MGQLELRLDKQHLGTDVRLGVVARVCQIKDADGNFPVEPEDREVVIPAGRVATRSVKDIPAGTYRIEARLPSGEVLRRTQEVTDDSPVEVTFEAGGSPNAWLSWQRLAGNVPTQKNYETWITDLATQIARAAQAKEDAAKPIVVDRKFIESLAALAYGVQQRVQPVFEFFARHLPIGHGGAETTAAENPTTAPAPESQAPTLSAEPPEFELVQANPLDAVELWDALGSLPTWAEWRRKAPLYPGCTVTREDDRQLTQWQIVQADRRLSVSTASGNPLPPRCLVVMRRGNGVDIVMLPIPWPLDANKPPVTVEVLREAGTSETGETSVTVRDDDAVGLIAYLAKGQMADADALLKDARRTGLIDTLLSEKFHNPLAACAAAYVGIATLEGDAPSTWRDWLSNLENSFEWLQDGAIASAVFRLRTAQTREDLNVALASLKQAYRRGVPYYSAGLRHLMNGLYRFSAKDAEAKEMHQKVAAVASCANPNQAFNQVTILPP